MSTHSQKRQRQSSIETALKEKFSQKKALNIYYSERSRDFLKYLSPDFAVPSRRKLSRDLKVMGSKAKSELTHLLSQNYVATTGKIYFFT
ncbi:Hypothetical protein FKW44_009521 [Caligus rogercresseyi]|uniref:Uncharacterized protein n=1 Tax=Caligus rogercresseyi TaxID=217165 RepID=A0A7T8HFE5_CALRO|nr:Hypothetical protein FKW44_009521 [Caligus rogercresseyi]